MCKEILSLPSCILFSLVPVRIPSIDYFLHHNLFVFILSWIGVGWSVQVHFGGGFLKPSPLHGNCWVQQIPCPTSAMKVLKCLSMVSTQDYQGDLKASLAGGVCNTNNVFANRQYCIRLCHPNKIYLLTYLLNSLLICIFKMYNLPIEANLWSDSKKKWLPCVSDFEAYWLASNLEAPSD